MHCGREPQEFHCPLHCGSGSKAQVMRTSPPPQVDSADNSKQTADAETRGSAGDPQLPAHGRVAGPQ